MVTGNDAAGKAVFVSDEQVEPIRLDYFPLTEFTKVWGADDVGPVPTDGAHPDMKSYFPPVGGYRFQLVSFPPAGTVRPHDLDVPTALAAVERELPGLMSHRESDAGADAGMHTTATVDLEVVLSGELTLELDDGQTRTMRPFDTIVQNGTRHRWRNPGAEPAVVAVFMIGAAETGSRSGDDA